MTPEPRPHADCDSVSGPTLQQRQQASREISSNSSGKNTPLVIGVVTIGFFGLLTVMVVAATVEDSTTVILTGLIATRNTTGVPSISQVFRSIDLDETEEAVAAHPAYLLSMHAINKATAVRYVKLYDGDPLKINQTWCKLWLRPDQDTIRRDYNRTRQVVLESRQCVALSQHNRESTEQSVES